MANYNKGKVETVFGANFSSSDCFANFMKKICFFEESKSQFFVIFIFKQNMFYLYFILYENNVSLTYLEFNTRSFLVFDGFFCRDTVLLFLLIRFVFILLVFVVLVVFGC